jgi:hypothetical protein
MKNHLRVIDTEDLGQPEPEQPAPRLFLPPLRELLGWITRQAVLCFALVAAMGYVATGVAIVFEMYRDPDPWRGLGAGFLFTLLLIVGIKTMRALERRSVEPGGGPTVFEQHHHHHHYHEREGA